MVDVGGGAGGGKGEGEVAFSRTVDGSGGIAPPILEGPGANERLENLIALFLKTIGRVIGDCKSLNSLDFFLGGL